LIGCATNRLSSVQFSQQQSRIRIMSKAPQHTVASRKVVESEIAKMARLREQRLASDAAKRAAGTFGDMSVIEIQHEQTGEVFVLSWKGAKPPELARLGRIRAPGLSFDEHERLQAWLLDQPEDFLKQTLIAWSLSAAEAKRLKDARIAERKAGGGRVVNDAPAESAPAASAGATGG
jgi:hypothetical protein